MKTIFSGIQPSGDLTIGNYFGAINSWLNLQNDYKCFFCIVDMHAITIRQEAKKLREKILEVLAIYMACGIDPDKNNLFIQSHVPYHAELCWILNCFAYMGELSRMTQYKDKSLNAGESIPVGLFTYPILMAADILLYNTDVVPVGIDQKQHLELARDIAQRFNSLYSETFKVPEVYIEEVSSRIMSLQNPLKKMSKSDENVNSYIRIMDDEETIKRKISKSVTDSVGKVLYSENQPGIMNLMNILMSITGEKPEDIERRFEGRGYGDFKKEVSDRLIDKLSPIRKSVEDYLKNKDYLEKVYVEGAGRAKEVSYKTLAKVKRKIGFI